MELTKASKPNDVVSFGTYPSSLVRDEQLITKLNSVLFNQYGVGVLDGKKYLKGIDEYYEFTDLEWIVLQKKPNGIFKLITKNIIDVCPREVKSDINPRTGRRSNYLNAIFPNRAFSEKERGMLQMTIREDRSDQDYLFVDFPDASVAEKIADVPIEFSDYVKRLYDGLDSYHLYKRSFNSFVGVLYEAFNIEKKEVFLESNALFPLGLRPVIEVKVE